LKSSGSDEGNRAESVSSRARGPGRRLYCSGAKGKGSKASGASNALSRGNGYADDIGEASPTKAGSDQGPRVERDTIYLSSSLVGDGQKARVGGWTAGGRSNRKRQAAVRTAGRRRWAKTWSESRAEGRGCWGVVSWRCAGWTFLRWFGLRAGHGEKVTCARARFAALGQVPPARCRSQPQRVFKACCYALQGFPRVLLQVQDII